MLRLRAGDSGSSGAHTDAVSRQDRPRRPQTGERAWGSGSGTRRTGDRRNPGSRSPPGTSGRNNEDGTASLGLGQNSQVSSLANVGGGAGQAGAVVTVAESALFR